MNPLSPGRLTAAEFLRLPDDDGNRYELADGKLLVTPPPPSPISDAAPADPSAR